MERTARTYYVNIEALTNRERSLLMLMLISSSASLAFPSPFSPQKEGGAFSASPPFLIFLGHFLEMALGEDICCCSTCVVFVRCKLSPKC